MVLLSALLSTPIGQEGVAVLGDAVSGLEEDVYLVSTRILAVAAAGLIKQCMPRCADAASIGTSALHGLAGPMVHRLIQILIHAISTQLQLRRHARTCLATWRCKGHLLVRTWLPWAACTWLPWAACWAACTWLPWAAWAACTWLPGLPALYMATIATESSTITLQELAALARSSNFQRQQYSCKIHQT